MAGVIAEGTFQPDNLVAGEDLVGDDILVAAGQNLARGSVLGRVRTSTPTTGTLAGTGDGTCTAVTGGPKTQKGSYLVSCIVLPVTHGGTFKVTAPNGNVLGTFVMPNTAGGTFAFESDEINFTLTDGAANFDLTSVFTIAVTDGVPAIGALTGTGNGTCTVVEGRRDLKVGSYVATCRVAGTTHGGTFEVVDPDGESLGTVSLPDTPGGTVDFTHDQIVFRLTDGSTNFIVGDYFTIVVSIYPRQVKLLDKIATDGSSYPFAVLSEAVNATSAAKWSIGYIVGTFNQRSLVFATGTDIEDVREAMREVGLLVVQSVAHGTI